jgi:hypothetical protein
MRTALRNHKKKSFLKRPIPDQPATGHSLAACLNHATKEQLASGLGDRKKRRVSFVF